MNISDKKEVLSKVLSENNADVIKTAEELSAMLDKELSKPENEIDFDLVNELSLQIIEARGDKPIENNVDEKLGELKVMKENCKKRFTMPKWLVGLAAACVIIMFGNIYSVSAWNMNIFTLFVKFTNGGVMVDFSHKDEIVLPTSESDPYGIIAKCEENGIYAETPHYLPEGLTLVELQENKGENNTNVYFDYEYLNQSVVISFSTMPIDFDELRNEHKGKKIEICGHDGIMYEADYTVNIVFQSKDCMVSMAIENFSDREIDKIIESIK